MAVQIVDRIHCTSGDLVVRVVGSDEIVACVPAASVSNGESVIGWIGANLVLVDFEDIYSLRGVLKVVGVERRRLRIIEDAPLASGPNARRPSSISQSTA